MEIWALGPARSDCSLPVNQPSTPTAQRPSCDQPPLIPRSQKQNTPCHHRQLPQCTQEPGWLWCGTSSPVTEVLAFFQASEAKKSKIRDAKQRNRSWVTLGSCQDPFICFHTNRSVTQKNVDKHSQIYSQDTWSVPSTVTRCTCPLRATGFCPDFTIIPLPNLGPVSGIRGYWQL